ARCGTKLCYIVRQAPFGRATLSDAELQIDFSSFTTPRDRVAVVATSPLTRDEVWQQGEPGTMWVFRGGQLRATLGSDAQTSAAARTSKTSGSKTSRGVSGIVKRTPGKSKPTKRTHDRIKKRRAARRLPTRAAFG
ncbi:MAG TPA: class II glutamine amidotransferase, partial [Polyangia bacterium]|nr:class II glutamine amidotransferase [Polyangia bacterium]